jgi:hypothetical protein
MGRGQTKDIWEGGKDETQKDKIYMGGYMVQKVREEEGRDIYLMVATTTGTWW